MPIGYGSNFPLEGITSEEVGTILRSQGRSIFGLLRILLTIGEIGAALIPGIGTLAEGAIGLAAGAANQLIDVSTGNQSLKNSLLNFLPTVGTTGIGAIRNVNRFNAFQKALDFSNLDTQYARNLSGLLKQSGVSDNLRWFSKVTRRNNRLVQRFNSISGFSKANKGLNVFNSKMLNSVATHSTKLLSTQTAITFADAANKGLEFASNSGFLKYSLNPYNNFPILKEFANVGLKGSDNAIRSINEDIDGIGNDFANVIGLSMTQRVRLLELLNIEGENGLLEFNQIKNLQVLDYLRGLNPQGNIRLIRFQDELENGLKAIEISDNIPKAYMKSRQVSVLVSTIQSLRRDGRMFSKAFIAESNAARQAAIDAQTKGFKNELKQVMMNPGSAKFNDWIVQPTQAIFDPNDLGRAPVEAAYRKLKDTLSKLFKGIGKTIKKADSIEDAFVKTGGVLTESKWIMGYKVIPTPNPLPGTQQMIMISFRPGATNNKQPVIVRATDAQLLKFIDSPGHTYLKYWALSKGRKVSSLGMFSKAGIFRDIKLINNSPIMAVLPNVGFSFVNINALRNILSLVSNVVENTDAMANGSYTKTYWSKLSASFTRNAISRSFRLLAKGVAGPSATRAFGNAVGRFIGAETQRIGTQILAKGISNVRAGKSFSNGLGKAAITGALTSVRGNLRRNVARRRPNSIIISSLNSRRKMYQFARIPNAVVPGRPFKGLKF